MVHTDIALQQRLGGHTTVLHYHQRGSLSHSIFIFYFISVNKILRFEPAVNIVFISEV